MGGDQANAPPAARGAEMTRHDPNAFSRHRGETGPTYFTATANRSQPSAWARDLEWGGGMTLMALVLAFGWITVRPTPRRRQPETPAPAYARIRDRR
ncbi:MAG: hypothetical protein QOJ38_1602 [Solirubrobacterales bacterium]|nr:hypothetical protein [Solirubrobacterales bacterium]